MMQHAFRKGISAPWIPTALIYIIFTLSGCRSSTDLIPRDILFSAPDKEMPLLSPDGRYLSYLAPSNDVLNLWIRTIGQNDDHPLTSQTQDGLESYHWAKNSEHVVFFEYKNLRDQVWTYSVNVQTGEKRLLIPADTTYQEPIRLYIIDQCRMNDDILIINGNLRDPQTHDTYRLNVRTGEISLVMEGTPKSRNVLIDHDGNLRAYVISEPDGSTILYYRDANTRRFHPEIRWPLEDDHSYPLAFAPDNQRIYMSDSYGRECNALVLYDPDTDSRELIYARDGVDIDGGLLNPITHELDAVQYSTERMVWEPVNDHVRADFQRLQAFNDGDLMIIDHTADYTRWLVAYRDDDGPNDYFTYNRESGEISFLFSYREALEGLPLLPREAIHFTTTDGRELFGYLTLPADSDRPLPLILNVQASGMYRVNWGFDAEAQWLANRGYACLQVNPRGSWGRGKLFRNEANREWGGKRQEDLYEAIRWAIREEIADPDRIAIVGGIYGGYAGLYALSDSTNRLVTTAVAVSPLINLESYLQSLPPYAMNLLAAIDLRLGHLPRYEAGDRIGQPKDSVDWNQQDLSDIHFLRERSPYYMTGTAIGNAFITQGLYDRYTPVDQMRNYAARLTSAGVNVELRIYDDETLGLMKMENRLDFYRRAEKFLSDHLGGDYLP